MGGSSAKESIRVRKRAGFTPAANPDSNDTMLQFSKASTA